MAAVWAQKTVFLVGSSMTQRAYELPWGGFGIGLSNWWTRCADVILRGQSGYNSRWTRLTLPEMIGHYRPDLVILFLGNNDSITAGTGQHVPVDEFRDNMRTILDTFRSVNPATAILLLTPTRATKLGRIDEVTALYTDVIVDLGVGQNNTAVVDLWTAGGEFTVDSATDLHDGLHLNQQGNKKVLLGIQHAVRTHFPQFVPLPNEPGTKLAAAADVGVDGTGAPAGSSGGLHYLFPAWSALGGRSVEEAASLIDAARLRSLL